MFFFFFQAEDGIRDLVRSRGLGDVYKRQPDDIAFAQRGFDQAVLRHVFEAAGRIARGSHRVGHGGPDLGLSLIHI